MLEESRDINEQRVAEAQHAIQNAQETSEYVRCHMSSSSKYMMAGEEVYDEDEFMRDLEEGM